MFAFGKIVGGLLLPPGIFILLFLLLGILALRGRRRFALGLGLASAILCWALSTAAGAHLLIAPLEGWALGSPSEGGPAASAPQAVVVLGGGYLLHSPETGGLAALLPESTQRALRGALLAEQDDLPLVFTGGSPGLGLAAESEADAAKRLWLSLGLPASRIRLETRSRDTFENARFTGALLGEGRSIYLVTSAWHMARAKAAFEREGFHVIPAPTAYRGDRRPLMASDLLPTATDLAVSGSALHEYLGLLWYARARH